MEPSGDQAEHSTGCSVADGSLGYRGPVALHLPAPAHGLRVARPAVMLMGTFEHLGLRPWMPQRLLRWASMSPLGYDNIASICAVPVRDNALQPVAHGQAHRTWLSQDVASSRLATGLNCRLLTLSLGGEASSTSLLGLCCRQQLHSQGTTRLAALGCPRCRAVEHLPVQQWPARPLEYQSCQRRPCWSTSLLVPQIGLQAGLTRYIRYLAALSTSLPAYAMLARPREAELTAG